MLLVAAVLVANAGQRDTDAWSLLSLGVLAAGFQCLGGDSFGGGTADGDGNAVSMLQSVFMVFGSGEVVPASVP